MVQGRGVIVTRDAHEYLLALSTYRQLSRALGLSGCYPVMVPGTPSPSIKRLFDYYNLTVVTLAETVPGADISERSQQLAERFSPKTSSIRIPIDATPTLASHAALLSLYEQRPIQWVEDNHYSDTEVVPSANNSGSTNHLVIARADSLWTPAAILYAQVCGKRVEFITDWDVLLNSNRLSECESAILVDAPAAFNKRVLHRIVTEPLSGKMRGAPSVLTAYTPLAFSGLIWRMLEYKAQRDIELPALPQYPSDLLDASIEEPLEYAILNEHGNESHMHYGHDVLCGAISEEFRAGVKRPFNCEQSCPHEPRRPAAQFPAHNLLILSCNTFTPSDGVVTPEYSLLLNFANGWPVSIIAAYGHASVSPTSTVLVDALVRSGKSQGEIVQTLNSVVAMGSSRDPVYVLLGDPDMTIVRKPGDRPQCDVKESSTHIELQFTNVAGRLLECNLPKSWFALIAARGERPTLVSRSRREVSDIYFSFVDNGVEDQYRLLIYSSDELSSGPWTLRIEPVPVTTASVHATAAKAVSQIRQQHIFGVDVALLQRMENAVLALLRNRGGHPHTYESLNYESLPDIGIALSHQLHLIQRALLEDMNRRTADRVWLSHHYAEYYPEIKRCPDDGRTCDYCGNPAQKWSYEDSVTGMSTRKATLCPRCGIVADGPGSAKLKIELRPTADIIGMEHRQQIRLHNVGDIPLSITYFVQFHSWRKLGVDGQTSMIDVTIPPHTSIDNEIYFHFARPLPDYIHDIMCYAMTNEFELYSVGQRVATRQKGMFVARKDILPSHGIHAADGQHHFHGHVAHDVATHAVAHQSHSPQPHNTDNATKRSILIVEPHAALFRYLHIARRQFQVIVVANRPDKCLQQERYFNRSMGMPTGTQLNRLIQCDTTSVSAMAAALSPWHTTIAGVIAGDDVFVPIAADLGRELGFDYASHEDGITQHLKTAMKQRFRERGVPTPRFTIASSLDAAKEAWESLGHDCVVKMVDFEASINVFRVKSIAQVENAWDIIMNNRNNLKMPFGPAKEVIVEEFISGRELTVEGYIQNNRVVCLNLCEKITDNFIVVGHLLPALVSQKEADILTKVAEQCVLAVGMRNTVFHVEMHLRGNDPYVIECAARPPGANMVELMNQSYGFDLMEISLALAIGEPVTVARSEPKKHFAMLALYSHDSGTLDHISGLEELKARGGFVHSHLDIKPGDPVHPLSGMHQGDGFVMLEATTPEHVREKADWFRKHVHLVIQQQSVEESDLSVSARA